MIKMSGLGLLLVSIIAFAADDKALKDEAQRDIVLSGYQCDQVDSIKTETSWFSSGTTANVTCDKAYHFLLRYKGGKKVSVEVDSM